MAIKDKALKVAIYYNHSNTLGHSMRVQALLKSIKRDIPGSKVVLFENGRTPLRLPLAEYAKIVPLPYSVDKKGVLIGDARGRCVPKTVKRMFRERQDCLRAEVGRFKPDIFVTEHFPFGHDFWSVELPPFLDYVKREIRCKVVGSAGYLNYAEGLQAHIRDFYDYLFVHSPKFLALSYLKQIDRRSAQEMAGVLKDYRGMINFTGFVLDKPSRKGVVRLRSEIAKKGFRKMVFVSRGGGVWNDEIMISSLLSARERRDWFFVICSGPATSLADLAAYQKLAKDQENVFLSHFLAPDIFDRYIAAADLCVSLSGYSTALKLMYFRKRAVLLPHTMSEQRWRAEWLLDYIPGTILRSNSAGVNALCAAMDEVLSQPYPKKKIPPAWFSGASQTARMLACLI